MKADLNNLRNKYGTKIQLHFEDQNYARTYDEVSHERLEDRLRETIQRSGKAELIDAKDGTLHFVINSVGGFMGVFSDADFAVWNSIPDTEKDWGHGVPTPDQIKLYREDPTAVAIHEESIRLKRCKFCLKMFCRARHTSFNKEGFDKAIVQR